VGKPDIEKIMAEIEGHGDLLLRFFVVFSRFEYALKKTNYWLFPGKVQPDWDRFGREFSFPVELADNSVLKAIEYFKEQPPKKQVYRNNGLDFDDIVFSAKDTDKEKLVKYVKTVRNNLFHGGKYPLIYQEDPSRNPKLIEACVTLLLFFLEHNKSVCDEFVGLD